MTRDNYQFCKIFIDKLAEPDHAMAFEFVKLIARQGLIPREVSKDHLRQLVEETGRSEDDWRNFFRHLTYVIEVENVLKGKPLTPK